MGVVLAFWAAVFAARADSLTAAAELEYKVKAGFIYNFLKFVDWPQGSFHSEASPFRIALWKDDLSAGPMKEALANKSLRQRRIELVLIDEIGDAGGCHLIFLSRQQTGRIAETLGRLEALPVLTVGEVESFAARGGVINFVRKGESFRFEVNLGSADLKGLKVSGQLANVATLVKTKK